MRQAIHDVLDHQEGNYMLPFFWQHGEDEETLRRYMGAIYDANIRAVCVEARPHPDFAGTKWWEDLDIIMDEARKRNMKVWVLDDAHFPTGYANGALKEAAPELCKLYLDVQRIDVCGPLPSITVEIESIIRYQKPMFNKSMMFGAGEPRLFDDDTLYAVVGYPLLVEDTIGDMVVDLSGHIQDGKLVWNVPDGLWRIFFIIQTRNGGGRTDYINMLDQASCRVQIDAVYEPHYARYQADFGKTFAGFFSDEPCVGNTFGFSFDETIGKKIMPLPWSDAMPAMIEERLGTKWKNLLPALWAPMEDVGKTGRVRYAYMDATTRLIQANFSEQIGNWCEEHGVEYIGHVIEDNNQHNRLGCSQGHFFRSMAGQHMSGIDDIGGQVLIGQEINNHLPLYEMFPPNDGEFFHYALGKLGSSHAHIDPKKQGRAMCEIFGNYGWSEGVRLMKYLADHFMVRGINYFVPHAFSPKAFPDFDCPPHFFAHGENPQYHLFGELMAYMNRVCHLFQNGTHMAPVALLYHGDADWAGEGMPLQKPARLLLENQIDFDIIPPDILADEQALCGKTMVINGEYYHALVIPYAQFLPESVLKFACRAVEQGFQVLFLDGLPEGASDLDEARALIEAISSLVEPIALSGLVEALRRRIPLDVTLAYNCPSIRYYHYRRGGVDAYMLNNESPHVEYSGTVRFKAEGLVTRYDAMENRLYATKSKPVEGKTDVFLTLRPLESIILIFDDSGSSGTPRLVKIGGSIGITIKISRDWEVSFCAAKDYPDFYDTISMARLRDIGQIKPDFSGHIRYESTFSLDSRPEHSAYLTIATAFEGPTVWINGQSAGTRLAPPYEFNISPLLRKGENTLRIEVATTLERMMKASNLPMPRLSRSCVMLAPIGIIGDVIIVLQ